MSQLGEGTSASLTDESSEKKDVRKCPRCGAIWEKTEPNLAQVRVAIRQEILKYENDLHQIDQKAELGYRGSIARGTVGNPDKTHYEMEPDIRGECGKKYDVDGFIFSIKIFSMIKKDFKGKRWARRQKKTRRLEDNIRKSLEAREELAYMKKGRAGFELLVRHTKERGRIFQKGGVIIIIHSKIIKVNTD